MQGKKLFLFDVMPLLYRAHFATMGKRFATTTGIDTRTTLVFFNYILQVLTEEKPDAVAAALDSKAKQRVAVSSTYKANREKMPSEIFQAFPYALQLLQSLQIPILKEEGHEADDVIAALARKGATMGYQVFIVSPDKDFAQLVTENVFLFRPSYKGATMETLDVEGVKNKYGVEPGQIADYLALRGDSVDNIIGVKGIGDKTAATLLEEYRSIESLLEGAGTIKQEKVREAITAYKDQLLENKHLATLTGELEVNVNWDDIKTNEPDLDKLMPLLDELQFAQIKERLLKLGFIKSRLDVPEQTSAASVPVRQMSLEQAMAHLQPVKKMAIGFLEQYPNRLFLFQGADQTISELILDTNEDWKRLVQFLEQNPSQTSGWHLKPLLKKLNRLGIHVTKEWIDLALGAYLLEPDAKIDWPFIKDRYELTALVVDEPYSMLSYLPSLVELSEKIMSKINDLELSNLLFAIELPLQSVITRMELHGINIDLAALKNIDTILTKQLNQLEKKLYEGAGMPFNLNSPSKTAEILQRIADPSELKKTKTGQVSTAEPFLIDLAPKYPFIADLLDYRKLNKIITTYVYSLPKYVDQKTNRIHPTFQQVVAGTGRIICTDPNLQNLPVKNEAGREVRKAIIPSADGFSILSADYNQVELRLLAELSGDPVMIEAFRAGKDIHTTTASRLFNVDEKAVTKDMRNKAKGINFGIAYGITPWGLATRLKISQKEAKQIIDAYFEEFASVKEYLESSVKESRERGFTKTRYGRIRYVEGIDSRNGTTRKVAERVAVNAPLQGLAADIIKEAMVHIDRFIVAQELRSRLILQVHDELVFDAADDELQLLVPELTRIMETGAQLSVPLKVSVKAGKDWFDQVEYAH